MPSSVPPAVPPAPPGGLLFLGTSESVGESVERFTPLDRGAKLFLRKGDWDGSPLQAGRRSHGGAGPVPPHGGDRSSHREPAPPQPSRHQITEEVVLAHHTPAAALVEESGEILYLHGQTGLFLEPAPGEAAMNIVKMAREGLRRDWRPRVVGPSRGRRPLLSDVTMPGMNGWDTLAALRAIDPAVRVVLTSGFDRERAMSADHAERPQAFISKPWTLEELAVVLEEQVGVRLTGG